MKNSYLFVVLAISVVFFSLRCGRYLPLNQTNKNQELDRAISSAVMIKLVHHKKGGSGVLIGKKKIAQDKYRYNVLTACHVIEEFLQRDPVGMDFDQINETKKLAIVVQDGFHNEPVICESTLINIEWSAPEKDWAIFSCHLPHDMPCAKLASRKEFESIKPFEHIFGVAGDDLQGLLCKEGIIAATHNIEPYANQANAKIIPWDKYAKEFFRPDHNIWLGASGGPIFSKDGRLIGIYAALTMGSTQPIAHASVAYKVHYIKELIDFSQPHLIIEENYESK